MHPLNKRTKVVDRRLECLMEERKNDELKCIVESACSSDLVDNLGMTLLHLAAKYNNVDIIKFLLNLDYNINARDSSGATPLLIAASYNQFEVMKVLLDANADMCLTNTTDQSILDILMIKIETVPDEVIEYCLKALSRSDVDAKTKGEMLDRAGCNLEHILMMNDAQLTQSILERMDTMDPRESQDGFNLAMKSLDVENVRVLLHYGPGKEDRKSLFFDNLLDMIKGPCPVLRSFETFVRLITSWDILNKDALDYFHAILISQNQKIVQVLLQCDIDTYARKKLGIDLIAGLFSNRKVSVVELLKDRAFNVNAQSLRGLSALHFALRSQMEENVVFLLDHGADPNIRDNEGKTPLLDCHAWSGKHLAQLLLQYGAEIQVFDNKRGTVCNVSSYKSILDLTIPHLAMLEAQGTLIDQYFLILVNCSHYVETYEMCCQQISRLKAGRFSASVTWFDIMTEKVEAVARQLQGEENMSLVEEYCRRNDIISYYRSTLTNKLQRILVVHRSKRNIAIIVSKYTKSFVNSEHLVVDNIFRYLTYRNMVALA